MFLNKLYIMFSQNNIKKVEVQLVYYQNGFFFNLPDMQIFQIKTECAVSTAKCMKIWKKMMTLSQMFLPDLRDHNFLASIYIYIHPHAAFFFYSVY